MVAPRRARHDEPAARAGTRGRRRLSGGGTAPVDRVVSPSAERRRPVCRRIASISSRYGRPIGIRSSHSRYSRSDTRDLPERPAGVATEGQDAARGVARAAARPPRSRPPCASRGRSRRRPTSGRSSSRATPSRARGLVAPARTGCGRSGRESGAGAGRAGRGRGRRRGTCAGAPLDRSPRRPSRPPTARSPIVGGAPRRVPDHLPRGVDRRHPAARLGARSRCPGGISGRAADTRPR